MNGKRIIMTGFIAFVVMTFVVMIPALGFGKTYVMTGKISAIDLSYQTVVIEVPMESKIFTVGGPLAPNADLSKNMKMAELKDFRVGERVTVKWHSTPAGHVIDRLVAK